jgi:hypothetical protein
MKEILRSESTISLEAAVLKFSNAELYLILPYLGIARVSTYRNVKTNV